MAGSPRIIPRWATHELLAQLETHRVVSVVGCRQSGKTTILLKTPLPHVKFQSLDVQANFSAAVADPSYFVRRRSPDILVIDEIQKVPQLIGEIKFQVDRNPEKGQYIISGSSDYRKLPQANESLAGRAGLVRVRTFSEAEQRSMQPGFLQALFDGLLPLSLKFDCSKEMVLETVIRGGYPEILSIKTQAGRSRWYASYLQNQVLLDMRAQWDTRKMSICEKVMECAAIFSSRELKKSALANQFAISWQTLDKYWSAIEAMFLVDMVDGWTKKDYDRPGSSPKGFMTDSGLMAHYLHILNPAMILESSEKSQNEGGKLVETWVYNQLMPEVDLNPAWQLNYFRSRSHEIDFLITNETGYIVGIEVKASESVSSDDFRHLKWFQDLVGKDNFNGIILYAGNEVRSGGNGLFALPMSALWSNFSKWEKLS